MGSRPIMQFKYATLTTRLIWEKK